jgi:cytidylate kinase
MPASLTFCHEKQNLRNGFAGLPAGSLCLATQAQQAPEAGQAHSLSPKRLLMRRITIAIDGYSACGKSSTARAVAAVLGYRYIDSGAMYRAVTLYFLEKHVALTNPREVTQALSHIRITFHLSARGASETYLNGRRVEEEIRTMQVSELVSQVSTLREVRQAMGEQQRKLGKDKGIVMDGRDIGTVVFPDAELKMFLTADIATRAHRRQQELLERDELVPLDAIIENLLQRDRIDSSRKESPLQKAPGAIELNTTHITLEEQTDEVVRLALGILFNPAAPKAPSRQHF